MAKTQQKYTPEFRRQMVEQDSQLIPVLNSTGLFWTRKDSGFPLNYPFIAPIRVARDTPKMHGLDLVRHQGRQQLER